jgi:hypothetical protein
MERRHPQDDRLLWLRFLEAERASRPEQAEAELAALFGALERPAPRPGFAGRVLARVRRRSIFARPAVRVAVAAALAAVAVGAALFAPAIGPLLAFAAPSGLLGAAAQIAAAVAGRLAAGAALWQDAAETARALARALLHPAVLSLLAALFAVATLGLRALAVLATTQRRGLRHAVP